MDPIEPPEPPLGDCFSAGVTARSEGAGRDDNPHPPLSRAYGEWDQGWAATLDLDEEDDPASDRLHKEDSAGDVLP